MKKLFRFLIKKYIDTVPIRFDCEYCSKVETCWFFQSKKENK